MAKISWKSEHRQIRRRLIEAIDDRIGGPGGWVERHVANCPRCRRRLGGLGRVRAAISLLKSQTHRSDLLTRANRRAVAMLKHEARRTTQGEAIRHALPRTKVWERIGRYTHSVASVAACLLIVLLMRMDILSSATRFHDQTQHAVRKHYARHLGEDIYNDLL